MTGYRNCQLKRSDASRGFTLIEVMIVVVIVGVLLAIAVPGYQSSMEKGRRSDAKSALLMWPIDRNSLCWIGEPIPSI